MKTLNYYNNHAEEFIAATLGIDMDSLYQPFLDELPNSARILDVGCGSGRDILAFKNKGYQVDAIDYSEALVKKAIQLTGIPVKLQSFYKMEQYQVYEGIWACASVLHCDRNRLDEVFEKLIDALKSKGVLYMSFKYGNRSREKDGREFTDLNEQQAQQILEKFRSVEKIKFWVTTDKRADFDEKWINLLFRKK